MEMPTVLQAAALVRTGEASAADLVELCLDAIDARNATLNAFVHLDPELARATAKEFDSTPLDQREPLAGMPFGVKDLEDCAGMPTTQGSRWFQGQPPVEHDSIHVARLRRAGAI